MEVLASFRSKNKKALVTNCFLLIVPPEYFRCASLETLILCFVVIEDEIVASK